MKRNLLVPFTIPAISFCHCKSGRLYDECCGPLLAGERIALTAEALMRSRYTAYVVRDIAYLLRSWHLSTRPDKINPDDILEWHDLHIVRTEKGMEVDSEGIVEFKAISFFQKKEWRLHEVSHFVKEDGHWLYVDGDIKDESSPVERRVLKVGRNDPCHCGSGRKFKKCCGL